MLPRLVQIKIDRVDMLIDANVFHGFYQVELGKAHSLCGCPKTLIESASATAPIYHDTEQIIESEWRRLVDYEWFDVWLATQLTRGSITPLNPVKGDSIEAALSQIGFPKSRDIVYVRTALAVVNLTDNCSLYTEDMDFYNPTLKGCTSKKRSDTLKKSAGPVPKLLRKRAIRVLCVP